MKLKSLIKKANRFDFEPIVISHSRKSNLPEEFVWSLVPELKRWLVMCAYSRKGNYCLIGPVDDLWHSFILFTHEYTRFCKGLGGYIHHAPAPISGSKKITLKILNSTQKNQSIKGYKKLLTDYKKLFDKRPNPAIWPSYKTFGAFNPSDPGCGGGCDLGHEPGDGKRD